MPKNTNSKKRFHIALPILFVIFWLLLAAIGGPYMGKIGNLSSTNLESFIPKKAESSIVNNKLSQFSDNKSIPAIIVYSKPNSGKLSASDMAQIRAVDAKLSTVTGVVGLISPPVESSDSLAAITVVPVASNSDFKIVFPALKQKLSDSSLPVSFLVAGPASFAYSLQNAFSGIDGTLLIVAVLVVFLILLIVYRSPFLPFIVLGTAVMALAVAVFIIYHLAQAGVVQLNGEVQGILFILVIGAATDYSLLYIARYREELIEHKTAWNATLSALKSSYQAIIAAGSTVTIGLLCLLFSDLGSNKALGPVGGIGIVLSMFATLTFLPPVLLLFGRGVFWPRKPHYAQDRSATHYVNNHPVWSRVGKAVGIHPRRIWLISSAVLIVACLGIFHLKAEGVAQGDLVLGQSDARDGQKILDEHFPSGSGSPAYVIASQAKQSAVVRALDADGGVSSVQVTIHGGTGSAPVGRAMTALLYEIKTSVTSQRNKQLLALHSSIEKEMAGSPASSVAAAYAATVAKTPSVDQLVSLANPFRDAKPKVVDGTVLLQAVLTDSADSLTARDSVQRLRSEVKVADSDAIIGGSSASQLDTNVASQRDVRVIMPLILLAITIILMVLLRAIVAPLILLLTTILSFGATMGISAWIFNNIFHFEGADPAVIIYGFVFLVALGIDYNIFLMTRIREETIKGGVRKGAIKGLIVTGGVITSAGIVLAATFASLTVIPILFLVEIAFIVTFGVLLDTIIVRSLLVPALTLEIGRLMWWPSKLRNAKK